MLLCLVAHDSDSDDFPALWADALGSAQRQPAVNWSWVMMRIATERGDLDTAQHAQQMPLAPHSGVLARQLHSMASAVLADALGGVDAAIGRLRGFVASQDRAHSTLFLPEALARLTILLAPRDQAAAEGYASRLETIIADSSLLARESCLHYLAMASLESGKGRTAAALAASARAVQVADDSGLRVMSARACADLARYTTQATRWPARIRALPSATKNQVQPQVAV